MIILLMWSLVAVVARWLERTWWSPGAFLALVMWISAVGTTVFAPEYYMSLPANMYLAILTTITSFATVMGMAASPSRKQQVSIRLGRPTLLFWFGMTFSLLSFFLTLQTIGVGLGDLTSPLAIMRAAQIATYQRYTEGLSFPIYYNISNAFVLSYAMAVAMIAALGEGFRWRFVWPLAIYVASNMLITTRAPILFMLLLMIFTALYAIRLRDGKFPPMFAPRVIRLALIGVGFVAGVFFLFQVLRFGENSTRSAAEVWGHLRRWPWGSLPGFSLWYDGHGGDVAPRVPGSYTFMGLYDILGIEERQIGGFGDYLRLSSVEAANIYTAFRGLWHDFGSIGSAIFLVIAGGLGGFVRKPSSAYPSMALATYVGIMSFFAFSFVVSFVAFTANIVALVMLPLLVRVTCQRMTTSFSKPMRNANDVHA